MKNKFIINTKKEFENLIWMSKNLNKKEKIIFTVLFFGAAIVIGINLYIPFIYKDLISNLENKIALNLILLFGILYTSSLILNYILDYISSILSYKIEKSYKEKLYKKIFLSKEKTIKKDGSSYYSEIISTDTQRASQSLNLQSINSLFSILISITAIIILSFIDIVSSFISIIYFIIYIYIFLRPSMEKNKGKIPGFEDYSNLMESSRKLISYVNDSLEGRLEIKSTLSQDYELEKFEENSQSIYLGFKRIWTKELSNFLFPFNFLDYIYYSMIFVWFYISYILNKSIGIDQIFFILTYIGIINSNITPFMNYLFKNRNFFSPSIIKIKDIFEFNDERENEEEKIIENIEEIKLENVDFSYTDKKILNDINLRIKKGDKIALIGKSGEGKTTLVKLITGEEKANKGNIFINSENIMNIKNIYEKIGVLSQNSHIFNRSIKENITMGRNIDEKKLKEVIELSGVKDFIEDLENGIYTITGQNGSYLSGGQRVRIALARMMLSEPEIIILDEPLEGVDKIKEEKVIENIKKYIKDKTVIIISHRFSILNMADRIIGLENGTIVLNDLKENALKSDNIFKSFFDAEKRMTFIKDENKNEGI